MTASLVDNYHFWEAMIALIIVGGIAFLIFAYCVIFWGDL